VQCATFSKNLNPRNIDKSVSDIRIRIDFGAANATRLEFDCRPNLTKIV